MITNAVFYRIAQSCTLPALSVLDDLLRKEAFAECGSSQEVSIGWTEPRGEANGALVESVGGQLFLKLKHESKKVPPAVIKRKVEERVAQQEASTGRKPGKKERKEMAEDVKLSLLPMAFSTIGTVAVWIDPGARLLVLGTSSSSRADDLVTMLVKSIEGFAIAPVNTQMAPSTAMSGWLHSKESPEHFSVDRECELKASDESKAVVKYGRHPLDIDEVRQHIIDGKIPKSLAMTWEGRVSFVLTEGLRLNKITFLEGVFDGTSKEKEDGFDADATILSGELSRLFPALIDALGGEMVLSADGHAATEVKEGEQLVETV